MTINMKRTAGIEERRKRKSQGDLLQAAMTPNRNKRKPCEASALTSK
jgi:hypothetical protein